MTEQELRQRAKHLLDCLKEGETTMGFVGGPEDDPNRWWPGGSSGQCFLIILDHMTALAEDADVGGPPILGEGRNE